jgi:hypothetical protein
MAMSPRSCEVVVVLVCAWGGSMGRKSNFCPGNRLARPLFFSSIMWSKYSTS